MVVLQASTPINCALALVTCGQEEFLQTVIEQLAKRPALVRPSAGL